MKQGQYVAIPETPVDYERLWMSARTLTVSSLPDWLPPERASTYRQLDTLPISPLSDAERRGCDAELSELEQFNVVIERREGSERRDIYIPTPEPLFSIGIYEGDGPLCLKPSPHVHQPVLSRDDVTDVTASFVADPFMVFHGGRWWMFFEVMNWLGRKGEIGCAESSDGRSWTYRGIVLREEFHLSYPSVFEWRGKVFMIPETFQAGSIRLYEARRFPDEWTLAAILLEGPYLVDPSPLWHNERWWLFAESNPQLKNDSLRLFSAADIGGSWEEHPCSPIVRGDSRTARPAGRIVRFGDKPMRFAQDCSGEYGSSVRAFEIVRLDRGAYIERQIGDAAVLSGNGEGWNAGGMHHVDAHQIAPGRWIACVDGWHTNY